MFAILKTSPHRNELDQPSFAHDAAYSDSKDLVQRNISNKILEDRAYKIARNRKYYECQRWLKSMFYKFLDKKTWSGVGVSEELAEELHTFVIKKNQKGRVYAKFKDNV